MFNGWFPRSSVESWAKELKVMSSVEEKAPGTCGTDKLVESCWRQS